MIRALFYLQFHTVWNRIAMRVKRLKQPKYLAGGVVGGLYFYFYFVRYLFGGGRARAGLAATPGIPHLDPALLESIGALILFVVLVVAWLVPHQRAALAFTEAEVAFLFPAPVSRRALIQFKLLRSQAAILLTSFFLVLVSSRFGGRVWIHAAGWWLILSTLNLHLLGSSFGRTMLLERGISSWQRRLIILVLLAGVVGVVAVWVSRSLPHLDLSQLRTPEQIQAFAESLLISGPIPYLLYPWRLVVRPWLAPNATAFLIALGPALLVLALHYLWVIRSNVAFEEASVDASRKLAERVAAVRSGNWRAGKQQLKSRRPPFVLAPVGPPAVALLWKNLLSAGQAFRLRVLLVLVVLGLSMSLSLGRTMGNSDVSMILGMIALMFVAWSLFLGPQLMRQDFRQDLGLAEVLKMYPLRGWQVAFGELLAPAVVLTALQWFLLLLSLVLLWHADLRVLDRPARLAVAAGAALLLPVLNFITLQIPNAAVLLFPAWFQTGKDGPQGIEATGQRIISMLAQLLVFVLGLLPAAIGFVVVYVVCRLVVGFSLALLLGSVMAAVILAVEAALGVLLLGHLFERLDLSAERTG
jgi:ABC-2 type transport system permease protein